MNKWLLILGAVTVGAGGLLVSRKASAADAGDIGPPTPKTATPLPGASPASPIMQAKNPAFALSFDVSKYRGIRNNNPGNIEWIATESKRWRGMLRADGRYGVFDTAANGVRAIGGELKASIRKGQNTVSAIITEWAPPSENPTAEYIAAVCKLAGVTPYQIIDVYSYMPVIAQGIIKQENGIQPYFPADIKAWVYTA